MTLNFIRILRFYMHNSFNHSLDYLSVISQPVPLAIPFCLLPTVLDSPFYTLLCLKTTIFNYMDVKEAGKASLSNQSKCCLKYYQDRIINLLHYLFGHSSPGGWKDG